MLKSCVRAYFLFTPTHGSQSARENITWSEILEAYCLFSCVRSFFLIAKNKCLNIFFWSWTVSFNNGQCLPSPRFGPAYSMAESESEHGHLQVTGIDHMSCVCSSSVAVMAMKCGNVPTYDYIGPESAAYPQWQTPHATDREQKWTCTSEYLTFAPVGGG